MILALRGHILVLSHLNNWAKFVVFQGEFPGVTSRGLLRREYSLTEQALVCRSARMMASN